MKLYLIVSKGKQKGLPIPIKVDLFLIGVGLHLPASLEAAGHRRAALRPRYPR